MDKTNFQLRTSTGKACIDPSFPFQAKESWQKVGIIPLVCATMSKLPGFEAWHRVCALFWYSLAMRPKAVRPAWSPSHSQSDRPWLLGDISLALFGAPGMFITHLGVREGLRSHPPLSFRSFQTLKFLPILKAFPTILSACLPALFFLLCSFSFSSRAPFQHLPSQ